MRWMLNSIGKKISFIGVVSLITIILLAVMTLGFFSKYTEISSINQKAYQYELLMKDAAFEYGQMVATNDEKHNAKLTTQLFILSLVSGRIGKIYRIIEQGNSMDEALQIYAKDNGDISPELEVVGSLIKSLLGTDLIVRMAKNSEDGYAIASAQLKLAKAYKIQTDPENRKKIIAQYDTLVAKGAVLLKEFHAVMRDVSQHFSLKIKKMFIIICSIAVIFISLIIFLISRSITKPLKETVDYVQSISEGKFNKELHIKSSDELGMMVDNMNAMSGNLKSMVKEIKTGIVQLNTSANDLTGLSNQVSDTASQNSKKASVVSSSAKEMASNMNAVSKNMTDSNENTTLVVTAVEEMTSTINEIALNTDAAKNITDKAVEQSKTAAEQMTQLGQVAKTIGKVTETITDISEQTNLLSLNATIEAARAGEAGKGFAVVANEIKELAKQTSTATLDIKEQIDQIQSSTKTSVEQIDKISGVIEEVSQIVATIATAIEEQSIATKEIAQNIAIVSEGVCEVNENVVQSSGVASEITTSITEVQESTEEMENNSLQVKQSALSLSKLAQTLNEMMQRFTI